MLFIDRVDHARKVSYMGRELDLDCRFNYLAISELGTLCAFIREPTPCDDGLWHSENDLTPSGFVIGIANGKYPDWRDTLVEV